MPKSGTNLTFAVFRNNRQDGILEHIRYLLNQESWEWSLFEVVVDNIHNVVMNGYCDRRIRYEKRVGPVYQKISEGTLSEMIEALNYTNY